MKVDLRLNSKNNILNIAKTPSFKAEIKFTQKAVTLIGSKLSDTRQVLPESLQPFSAYFSKKKINRAYDFKQELSYFEGVFAA